MLFVDNGKVHPGAWLAIVFFELSRGVGIGIFYLYPQTINDISFVVVQIIGQLIMLVFAAHTLYLAYQGYAADLLEQRRRLRLTFLLIMGILLLIVVGSDFISQFSRYLLDPGQNLLPAVPSNLVSLYILIVTFLFCQRIFQLSEEATSLISSDTNAEGKTINNGTAQPSIDPALLKKIEQTMEQERLYAQTGLTISDLAETLSIQEYRLRKVINQQLNFRNFNQFLNNYRIEEACKLLRESSSSISSIALEVGYASLSVFNKAFKECYKVTPTVFRSIESRQSQGTKIP